MGKNSLDTNVVLKGMLSQHIQMFFLNYIDKKKPVYYS